MSCNVGGGYRGEPNLVHWAPPMTWWERKRTRLRRRWSLFWGQPWKKRKWRCKRCNVILPRLGAGAIQRINGHSQMCLERTVRRLEQGGFDYPADPRVAHLQQLAELVAKTGLSMEEAIEAMKKMNAIDARLPLRPVAEETDGYVGPPSFDWERGV